MTEAIIQVPGNIKIDKVPEEIIYRAFAIAVEEKCKEIKRELKKVKSKLSKFEKKYKMTLEEFEGEMGDTLQAHDDWMDWSFLQEQQKQLQKDLQEFDSQ